MTRKEIIDGLKFTVEMFLFDPRTGETFTEPRNNMDKTTIDACRGAIELLEQADGDLISRQAVINALHNANISFTVVSTINFKDYQREIQEIVDNIVIAQEKAINELSSAENTAEWIDNKDVIEITQEIQHHYMCSKCGMYFDRMTKYCPNCGRRMKGVDE